MKTTYASRTMEAILFVGVQAVGKSTFYAARFADSHVRINRDMLRTAHRERILLDACLRAGQPLVVDNTNLTAAVRARYIGPARGAGFQASTAASASSRIWSWSSTTSRGARRTRTATS
ncbi:MAG TPA: hypothetical protein VIC57_09790 [Candidatus Dormibacteraeota bacterium]|jgi:predicted kinase